VGVANERELRAHAMMRDYRVFERLMRELYESLLVFDRDKTGTLSADEMLQFFSVVHGDIVSSVPEVTRAGFFAEARADIPKYRPFAIPADTGPATAVPAILRLQNHCSCRQLPRATRRTSSPTPGVGREGVSMRCQTREQRPFHHLGVAP
jgi:hypothetical protein